MRVKKKQVYVGIILVIAVVALLLSYVSQEKGEERELEEEVSVARYEEEPPVIEILGGYEEEKDTEPQVQAARRYKATVLSLKDNGTQGQVKLKTYAGKEQSMTLQVEGSTVIDLEEKRVVSWEEAEDWGEVEIIEGGDYTVELMIKGSKREKKGKVAKVEDTQTTQVLYLQSGEKVQLAEKSVWDCVKGGQKITRYARIEVGSKILYGAENVYVYAFSNK